MKLRSIFIASLLVLSSVTAVFAVELSGKVSILNNDGSNYKVLLQINTDIQSQKLGGATIVVDFDTTSISFPDNPQSGSDFIFANFNLGYYDTAKVTKISNGEIWINIDLTSDGNGTLVEKGPDSWTDLVTLNFASTAIIVNNPISWNINSKYWQVYDSDNFSVWGKGNFDFITDASGSNHQNNFSYVLSQNYPNPFNPSTKIEYRIPERSSVSLVVYNTIGQQISILTEGEKEAGTYSIEYNAENLPSGIYFYRIQAGNFVQTKKMVLLK